ncbi:putative RNA 2'-phosphotransferase [Candidatus Sulfopaludibacter sp. SbA4]|nr:putative RNA 2'-phosphotransferase [Candidatus Sulfopaludibacter sp. SbA4]
MGIDDIELSKAISHALRHEPSAYGLTLDPEGWVNIRDLLAGLARVRPEWEALSEEDVSGMVARSRKRRHEISLGRIRALYGHSTPERVPKAGTEPPPLLYHGTDAKAADLILCEGLKPMARQYVHLSLDRRTARQVGLRKDAEPVVLVIDAGRAHGNGVAFYQGNESVWLADFVPAAFIVKVT